MGILHLAHLIKPIQGIAAMAAVHKDAAGGGHGNDTHDAVVVQAAHCQRLSKHLMGVSSRCSLFVFAVGISLHHAGKVKASLLCNSRVTLLFHIIDYQLTVASE